jgi:alpha-mannosidase
MKLRLHCALISLLACATAPADTAVRFEYGEIKDGTWKFPSITSPSKSDLVQGSKITVLSGVLHADGAAVSGLTDGTVGNTGGDPAQAVFFANACLKGGKWVVDLGSATDIRQINTFSFHTWDADQGGRGPQVYTLSGSTDNQSWVRIADVDSRPNMTGENWGNRPQGVQIAAADGKDLGRFRYLLFDVKPTGSPLTNRRQSANETWSNTFFMELDVHSAATLATSIPAKVACAFPNLEEVIITWKCHLDIGYTHTVPEVINKYRTHDMDQLLAMFDQTKGLPEPERFRWMLPAWALDVVLDGNQTPERRAKLEQAVKDGRLLWHALPFTFETEAADLEELVRDLSYGSRLARRFNVPLPIEAKQTDMPEQAWAMPTLLAHAGIKYLHIGANSGSKPHSETAKIPTLCWWEGPDGSRVLLGMSDDYGWGSITPPRDWKHKTWLAFFVRGDNQGPPSPQDVENILARARQALPGVNVRFGRPGEFAEAIIAEEKANPTLPVIRGDMPDTWVHGQMSCPMPTQVHRHAGGDLITLGLLDTTLKSFGLVTEPVAPLLDVGYRNSGFYAEHTWGLNGGYFRGAKLYQPDWRQRFEAGEYKKFDDTYEYHMNYGRNAEATAREGLAPRLAQLAGGVKCEGPRAVVFNPLPWPRDAVVEVKVPATIAVAKVTDAATGKPVAFEQDGETLRIEARALPPGGYTTFAIRPGSATVPAVTTLPADGVLKTEHFTARFDLERGGIASLVENSTGRELVAQGGHALGQFMHERFSLDNVRQFMAAYTRNWARDPYGDFGKGGMPEPDKSPYAAITPAGWQATVKRSPIGDDVVLSTTDTRGLAKSYQLRFSFPRSAACVDVTWTVTDKTADPIPEGGWLCLPLNVEAPAFRVGRIGGTMDPARDIIFGANRNLMGVDRAITVRAGERGAGVAAASADLPLWSLGKPGLWLYEPTYVPTRAELFANLYNNEWNTNYPLWIYGSWQASLRLWPVAPGASEEQADFTPAWELRQGPVAAFADGKGGALPPSQPGVSLSRKGVRVTAFCPNPDGDGTILRLWEQAGLGGPLTAKLPAGFTTALPVNLRGEKLAEPIALANGTLTIHLGPYAPASFVLKP